MCILQFEQDWFLILLKLWQVALSEHQEFLMFTVVFDVHCSKVGLIDTIYKPPRDDSDQEETHPDKEFVCASECCARVSDKQGLTRVLCNVSCVLLLFQQFHTLCAHNPSHPKQKIILRLCKGHIQAWSPLQLAPYIVTHKHSYIGSCSRYQQVRLAATYVGMVMCDNVGC